MKDMKKHLSHLILTILVGLFTIGATAQASMASEGLEWLIKRVVKAGASSADNVIKEAAERSPAVARIVRQYGPEAIVTLARNPNRVRLVERLGDDAAEAMLKHANIAEDMLNHCPDAEVATALKTMSRESGQYLSMCTSKHAVDADGCKTLALIVKEGGDDAAKNLSKMSPSTLEKVLYTAQTIGLTAAATMVISTAAEGGGLGDVINNLWNLIMWLIENPILSILILALLVTLILKFPTLAKTVLLWIPQLCWKGIKKLVDYLKKRFNSK